LSGKKKVSRKQETNRRIEVGNPRSSNEGEEENEQLRPRTRRKGQKIEGKSDFTEEQVQNKKQELTYNYTGEKRSMNERTNSARSTAKAHLSSSEGGGKRRRVSDVYITPEKPKQWPEITKRRGASREMARTKKRGVWGTRR